MADLKLGWLREKKESDPRTILTGLAGLILKRTRVGATGKGTYRTVRYRVRGHGTARTLSYTDPNTGDTTTKHHVRLPWETSFPMAELGDAQPPLQVTAMAPPPKGVGMLPALTCTVTVGGKQVATETQQGVATCTGHA